MSARSAWTLAIEAALDDPTRKRVLNERLFTEVAPRYDLITRLLSFGRDSAWKRGLIADLPALAAPRCLDLACGTGDLTALLAARYPGGTVLGIDLTESMLIRARAQHPDPRLTFSRQDMQALDVPSASVEVVTGGYAVRNAPDLDLALAEIHRVLVPGGTAAFLDFARPASPLGSRLQLAVLAFWGGLWGLAMHRDPGVYAYLAHSLARFPDRVAWRWRLEAQGFRIVSVRRHLMGMLEAVVIEKLQ